MKIKQEEIMVKGFPFLIPGMTVLKVASGEILPTDYIVVNHSVENSMFSNDMQDEFFVKKYVETYNGKTRVQIMKKSDLGNVSAPKEVVLVEQLVYVEADFIELERAYFNFPSDQPIPILDVSRKLAESTCQLGKFDYQQKISDVSYENLLLSNLLLLKERQIIDNWRASAYVGLIRQSQ